MLAVTATAGSCCALLWFAAPSPAKVCTKGGAFHSTSYGPPWGGINGGGITAAGINLRAAPRTFGIAVDPHVIRLGSRVYIWPNPFRRRHSFKAFDTGGAINGNRVDFYDYRGRSKQLGWGRRTVKVCRLK